MKDALKETIEINKKQRDFYNTPSKKKNAATKLWSKIRNGVLSGFRNQFNIKQKVYNKHKEWLEGIENYKVLDLGCLYGNHHTMYMAENAKSYIGIDLSDKAINSLEQRLRDKGFKNAKALAVDFLSDEFDEEAFDLIYAYGVMHHFADFDMLLDRIDQKLKPGGKIILYDPLQTSFPIKVMRMLYRPFQSDKDWEWPFTKKTFKKLYDRYDVLATHGILGASKWGLLLKIVPASKGWKQRQIKSLVDKDWNIEEQNELYKCMHVTMHLQRKTTV
ncbi:class I SAM-dependent methyltransferase [Sungkyunkwania multivorans]|uniref:Class I SAM-dependent methyltransferase n=1 Tax=Sungkyunkwania multivorans TaxID=1173618 RepID=A0ABW3D514_9FLAO